MRLGWSSVVVSVPLALAACSGSFGTSSSAGPGGDDASDENPPIHGGGGDSGHDAAAPDGTTADAAHPDATGSEGGTGGGEGGADAPSGCPTGEIQCNGACVPSDVHNCGTCGHDCTNLAHVAGATTCTAAGACSFPVSACAAGWADCNGNPDDGCEQDVTTPAHCGTCTNMCPSTDPVCATGTCVTGCPTGTPTLCGGTCVDTTSNANDCNGCGKACPSTVANSQPSCVSSLCSFTCNGGFTGCPTTAPTECADTTTDLSNCGSCGDACSTAVANGHPTCAVSQCGFACNTGFLLCNANTCIPQADTVNGAFVSPGGSGATCSATQPCATVAAAIATGKTILYLDKGTYSEQVTLPGASLAVHGGWSFSGGMWTNCGGTSATSILVAPAGQASTVTTSSSGTWALDTLTIENNTTASAGQSLYGVLLGSGGLTLTNVSITVAPGGAGGNATGQGTAGVAGTPPCLADTGAPGDAGAPGPAGPQGTYGASGFVPASGVTGSSGTPGHPGVQATGATPVSTGSCCDNGGCTGCSPTTITPGSGASGCGGTGGGGGPGGFGGGASIGVFAAGAVTFGANVSVGTGSGGAGGNGGSGGSGGPTQTGATGTFAHVETSCKNTPTGCRLGVNCFCQGTGSTNYPGTAGTVGGAGGNGGPGSGGSGGASLCLATAAGAQIAGAPACSAGAGGPGGNQGQPGQGTTGLSGPSN